MGSGWFRFSFVLAYAGAYLEQKKHYCLFRVSSVLGVLVGVSDY